ncbi:MAG TPA: GNAT family N-acetyltransferase, partial [Acidimicrobiales bacterium]|nr:GNAT family N-acetyltransferase [Acidimicrobiales bacterium]
MRTRILRGGGHWATIGPAWRTVAEGRPVRSFMGSAAWAEAISEAGRADNARWVVVDDDEGALAVLPLEVRRRTRGPVGLRLLVNDRTSDGVVADRARPAELRAAVLAAMADQAEPVDVVDLRGLRDGWGLLRLAVAGSQGLVTEVNHGGHSVVDTDRTSEQWTAAAGKNLRAALRKAGNRSARAGALTVTEATDAEGLDAALDEFVAIESSGWKAGTGALSNRPAQEAVMRHFLRASAAAGAAADGSVAIRTLRLDGRPAAAQITFHAHDTLDLLKVAYDDELSDLSPSNLLMADLVRSCCDRTDVARIDLVTRQPWHERWRPTVLPTYRSRDPHLRRPGGLGLRLAAAVRG